MKKLLCLLLALTMCIGLLSVGVLADEPGQLYCDNGGTSLSQPAGGGMRITLYIAQEGGDGNRINSTDYELSKTGEIGTVTWNGENELGYGAVDSTGGGLTEFGKEVVKRMNTLGMAVDVSHLSERGFWDVAEISKKPFIASHSNAKAICDHARNLTDDQIRALIKAGGVAGINFCASFLNDSKKANVKDIVKHIEHMLSCGAEDNIGLGTDFDGISLAPDDVNNAGAVYMIFDELKKLGYSDELIEKISHKNFERVFGEILN